MEYFSLYFSFCSKSLSWEVVLSDIRDPFHHWSTQFRMLLINSSQFEGFNSQIVFTIDPLGKRGIPRLQGLVMTLLLNHYSLSVVIFGDLCYSYRDKIIPSKWLKLPQDVLAI